MLVVVEGMDNSGKTTLAKKIIQELPQFQYTRPTPSTGPTRDMTGQYMMDRMWELFFYHVQRGEHWVSDRLNLISEPLYGPLLRSGSRLSYEQYRQACRWFWSVKPVVIFCRPPLPVIKEGPATLSWEKKVQKNAEILVKAYDSLFHSWQAEGRDIFYYDYLRDPEGKGPLSYIRCLLQFTQRDEQK